MSLNFNSWFHVFPADLSLRTEESIYFTVGLDVPRSLFDRTIQLCRPNDKFVSFFFGGVGDARHMLYTIIYIAQMETNFDARKVQYHFLVNDHNIHVLARNLVIMKLIENLSKLEDFGSEEATLNLSTLFFVYNAPMMPNVSSYCLLVVLQHLVETLGNRTLPVPGFLIYDCDRQKLIAIFEAWIQAMHSLNKNSAIIDLVRYTARKQQEKFPKKKASMSPEFEEEEIIYSQTAALLPPRLIQDKFDIGFHELVRETPLTKENAEKLRQHLEDNWKFNVTFIDTSAENQAVMTRITIGEDPFDLALKLHYSTFKTSQQSAGQKTCLYDHITPFFVEIATSIKQLRDRIRIETVLGDCNDVCEKLQYGLLNEQTKEQLERMTEEKKVTWEMKDVETDGRQTLIAELETEAFFENGIQDGFLVCFKGEGYRVLDYRPNHFPVRFDRVHLSNVP